MSAGEGHTAALWSLLSALFVFGCLIETVLFGQQRGRFLQKVLTVGDHGRFCLDATCPDAPRSGAAP